MLFFHSTTGIKSLVLQNVTFTNVEKLVFEPFVSVDETDDGVNFGKNIVRIDFNSQKNGRIRTLKGLEIGSTTCRNENSCMIENGNTTSCKPETTPAPADDGQNEASSTEGGSTEGSGEESTQPFTSERPESSTSKAFAPTTGYLIEFLAIAHLLALMYKNE